MTAERVPIKNMEKKIENHNHKKTLVGELVSLTEAIRGELDKSGSIKSITEFAIDTNETIIGVNADKNVVAPGTYQFEVMQLARKSSAFSSGFEDPNNSYIGVGYIQYTLPNGDTKDIYVDSDNASLHKVAKLINDDIHSGMKATVVNDGSGSDKPWKLLMSLTETGEQQKAEFPFLYFVDGEDDFFLEEERAAQNAKVKLEGFEIELPSNDANNLIPGLAIDLKKAAPGEEFPIIVKEDTEAISEKFFSIIEKINAVFAFIKEQNTMDENTDTSKTLGGDIILQTLESRLRSTVFQQINTRFGPKRLGDLGIKFQKTGLLDIDKKAFNALIDKDFKVAAEIMGGHYDDQTKIKTPGFLDNLKTSINEVLRSPSGLLQSRKKSVQTNIDEVQKKIESTEQMLVQKEKNLKEKFARLEETMSKIKSQGAGLAALGAAGSAGG
jgi:flagellar hook-associated protein 2